MGGIDILSARMDVATASLILCDELPELVTHDRLRLAASDLVRDRVLSLERDAFQQTYDALRSLSDVSKSLAKYGCGEAESEALIRQV